MKRVQVAVLCLLGCACSGDAPDLARTAFASIDDEPLLLSDLEIYLQTNLLSDEGSIDGAETDLVKSRLLDRFIEERALLAEAERRGLQVSDAEIDAYLGLDGDESHDERADESRRRLGRQRMMVHKLQDTVATKLPPATDEEVRAYLEENRSRLLPERRVLLRSLRFESAETAERVHDEIGRRRMTFAEAVVVHEKNPRQGVALEVSWSNLSGELREALGKLKAGQVSRPLNFHGDVYLFQVDSWLDDPPQLDEEMMGQARRELERVRRDEAVASFVERVRSKARLSFQPERLSFRYVPEGV